MNGERLKSLDVFRGATVAAMIVVAYWVLLTQAPVPGHGKGDLSPEGNLASYLDRLILGGHMYTQTHDPEGILSTMTAVATTVMGVWAGCWLKSQHSNQEKVI